MVGTPRCDCTVLFGFDVPAPMVWAGRLRQTTGLAANREQQEHFMVELNVEERHQSTTLAPEDAK